MNNLDSNETSLKGAWVMENGTLIADKVSKRIESLIQTSLKELATSDDGWDKLYIDPEDSRYWELVYDDSGLHGGGAPHLRSLSSEEASKKYSI